MNILITGKHSTGKSNLEDLLRNQIFLHDPDAAIHVDDEDRATKNYGSGKNPYTIKVRQVATQQEEDGADIVIHMQSKVFAQLINII